MNPTKELIKKIYAGSKEEVTNLISSEELMTFIVNVGTKFSLNQEQKNSLGAETTSVLLGVTSKDQFLQKSNTTRISTDKLSEIYSMIENELLKKIPKDVWANQLNFAKEMLSGTQSTIKSTPEIAEPEKQPLAPGVIVERHEELQVGERPKTNLTFEERKKLVPKTFDNKPHYADKIDPYREPI